MLDLLPPWALKATVLISALVLLDVLLYMLCVRVERRSSDHYR
jgi:hypothetical protein